MMVSTHTPCQLCEVYMVYMVHTYKVDHSQWKIFEVVDHIHGIALWYCLTICICSCVFTGNLQSGRNDSLDTASGANFMYRRTRQYTSA